MSLLFPFSGDDNSHGLFPNVFNLAATSVITVNATCGESAPEVYCKLVEHVDFRSVVLASIVIIY